MAIGAVAPGSRSSKLGLLRESRSGMGGFFLSRYNFAIGNFAIARAFASWQRRVRSHQNNIREAKMSDRTLTLLDRQKALQKRWLKANPPRQRCARTLPEREQQSSEQHASVEQQQASGNQ